MPQRNKRRIEAAVAGLQVEVRHLRQATEKNTESLSEMRDGFQRPRGEINGVLPPPGPVPARAARQRSRRGTLTGPFFGTTRTKP